MEQYDDEIVELGAVSEETKGGLSGACMEQSLLPYRLFIPGQGCPKP